MFYVNTKTGARVKSPFVITGSNWELEGVNEDISTNEHGDNIDNSLNNNEEAVNKNNMTDEGSESNEDLGDTPDTEVQEDINEVPLDGDEEDVIKNDITDEGSELEDGNHKINFNTLTKKELIEYLDGYEIKFNQNAKKQELVDLLINFLES